MMNQMGTRKRPAPGTLPLGQTQAYASGDGSGVSNAPSKRDWQSADMTEGNSGFVNDPTYNSFNGLPISPQQQLQFSPSGNQVIRRPTAQNLIAAQDYGPAGGGGWDGGAQIPVQESWQASYDDLDQRAELAKRDAQAKRKQIPPFIQKLSSFLDESRNTDLIRWSDSGDSFIVLDEDEFAKKLIPELFKHNNYASFVRQLNMYGFHKKVGLSDNSMRASERKNKNPSEYSNPFFKRGRQNLLWLIHKPRSTQPKASKGRNRLDDDEDVDETFGREASPMPTQPDSVDAGGGFLGRQQPLLTMGSMADRLPQDELTSLKQELKAVQENQKMIKEMLTQTRREHQQLYGQAKAFHDLHEKHDNSINAILQFLATVYNKNLAAGQTGSGDMFPGKIQSGDQPRGNVVDIGEEKRPTSQPYRRPQLLLEAGSRSPVTPMDTPGLQASSRREADKNAPLHSPAIQELSDYTPSNRSSESPPASSETTKPDSRQPLPEADILRMMNNASAQSNTLQSNHGNTHIMDFPEALTHLQNSDGQTPLTPNQRQNMLRLMANEHSAATPIKDHATGNALTSYATPENSSISNDLVNNFNLTTDQLNQIQQSLREQEERMNNLQNTIAPLSPSGSIPGVNDGSPSNFNPTYNLDPYDIDQFLNSGDYFDDVDTTDLPDFDFSTTGGDGGGEGASFANSTDNTENMMNSNTDTMNTAGRSKDAVSPADITSDQAVSTSGGGTRGTRHTEK